MRIFLLFVFSILLVIPVFSATDKSSVEYLKNKKHIAILNPLAESIAQKVIKKNLQKNLGKGKYNVKFEIYTMKSLKNGIFKTLEIYGEDININKIPVTNICLKNITDYNWVYIDTKDVIFKSDVLFYYEIALSKDSINNALEQEEYKEKIVKLNKKFSPFMEVKNLRVDIKQGTLYVIIDYLLPLNSDLSLKTMVVSTDFTVENGKILPTNICLNKHSLNVSFDKILKIFNIINPLTFTLSKLNENNCKASIKNVKIIDDILKINGKILINKGV